MVHTLRELNERGVVRVPRHAIASSKPIATWRWLALLAVTAAMLHDRASGGGLVALLEQHDAALLPIASVAGAWPLVLIALFGYGVFQLVEDQRSVAVYDLTSRHVVALALLASLSVVTVQLDSVALSAGIAVAMAAVAGAAYVRAQDEVVAGRAPFWIGAVFALAFGFTATMAMTAVESAIATAGCPSTAPSIAACIASALVATRLGLRFRDPVLPAFIGFSLIAVCAANRSTTGIAGSAFLGGTACAATAIVLAGASRLANRIQPAQHTPPVRARGYRVRAIVR